MWKGFLVFFILLGEFNKINVTLNIENETFYASGKVCTKLGYKVIDAVAEKNDTETNLDVLNKLKKGQIIKLVDFEIKDSETSPPTRYSSGSIILAMENAGKLIEDETLREQIKGSGIGTSATRAEIIKKLERINYIEINPKTQIITPSKKGEIIYDVVYASIPDMLNPELTASWEKGLDMVAKKEIEPTIFMDKLEKYVKSKINRVMMS